MQSTGREEDLATDRLVIKTATECCQILTTFSNSNGFTDSFKSNSDSTFVLESQQLSGAAEQGGLGGLRPPLSGG